MLEPKRSSRSKTSFVLAYMPTIPSSGRSGRSGELKRDAEAQTKMKRTRGDGREASSSRILCARARAR
jgi:hypothetical protein